MGWGLLGHWGRQSPIVLSTAHRFIHKPRVKRTAGSRVDSVLNSFGDRWWSHRGEARGWEEQGHPWQEGRPGHNPGGKYGHIKKKS